MKAVIAGCLLLAGLTQAVDIYLNPAADSVPCHVSPSQANLYLSQHLRLELFEAAEDRIEGLELSLGALNKQPFVGRGVKSALLLSLDEQDANDAIPTSLKPSFTIPPNYPSSSFPIGSVLLKYIRSARHAYTSVFSALPITDLTPAVSPRVLDLFLLSPSEATSSFLSDLAALTDFIESDYAEDRFGAFDLTSLSKVAFEYGRTSEHYLLAKQAIHSVLSAALSDHKRIRLALITYPAHTHSARRQPPQSPLPPNVPNAPSGSATLSCHASLDACTNATGGCSGHGSCVQGGRGHSCFVCACNVTRDARDRREYWAGDSCQRKDVSGPFVLLTGTTVAILLLFVGSLSLLYGIGTEELPSVLTSTAGGHHRSQ